MGFSAGFNAGSAAVARGLAARQHAEEMDLRRQQDARAQAEHDLRVQEYQRKLAQQREVDQAFKELGSLQANGVLARQNTGLSDPSAQMVFTQGYGDASGAQAVRDIAGDFARENARMGLARSHDAAAPVETRAATRQDTNAALQRVAIANRDPVQFSQLETKGHALKLDDDRKAELKRLQALPPEALAQLFDESVSSNPDVPAMVDFDPKSRKYVIVSRIPGIPTQTLSRAEMLQAVMGAWEAGNGNYDAGVQALVAAAQNARALENSNFERSRHMAGDNANLHFKGLQADNDAQRTRNDSARVGLARQRLGDERSRAAREDWAIIGASDDNKGLLQFNKRTGETRVQTLPPGTDAGGLFRKLTGAKGDGGEFSKLPEDGTRVRDNRTGKVLTYAEGVPVLEGGVAPSLRGKAMAKLQLPAEADAFMQWESGGRHVSVPADSSDVYDIADPRDVAALRQALARAANAAVIAREAQSSGGFAPRYPGGPGPEARAAIQRSTQPNRLRSVGPSPTFGQQR